MYHSPVQGKDSPVDKYSYLGMAVTSGNFLPAARNCGEFLSYAVGAPRSNGTGQVVIFVKSAQGAGAAAPSPPM